MLGFAEISTSELKGLLYWGVSIISACRKISNNKIQNITSIYREVDITKYSNYAAIRDGKALSDYRVALGTGIAPATLSDWKLGKTTPKIDKLIKIADFLGVTLDALCREGTDEH